MKTDRFLEFYEYRNDNVRPSMQLHAVDSNFKGIFWVQYTLNSVKTTCGIKTKAGIEVTVRHLQ